MQFVNGASRSKKNKKATILKSMTTTTLRRASLCGTSVGFGCGSSRERKSK